ncbi:MAG: hypothetical protein RLZ98_1083 [Pseudomonadota bacterium]|jgi:L-glyceraldehyde 3-phosphate reductase
MQTRRLASTGIGLSEVAFGCGGNAGLMVRGTHGEQTRTVSRALDLGINYFDNSPDYGNGAAEENLGRALAAIGHRPLLNSKVEIRAENLADIAGHVVRSCEASLRRLGVDYLDVFQIHNGPITPAPHLDGKVYTQLATEDFLRAGGAIEGLQRLRDAGKVRATGFICRGNDGEDVRRLLATGVFDIINVPYTLLNPTAGMAKPKGLTVPRDYANVISAARSAGVGCAIYSPLAGGFLTDAALTRTQHPLARAKDFSTAASERNRRAAEALAFLKDEATPTLAQVAFRFILGDPGVTTVLGGFSSIEQLEELAEVSGAPPFPPAKLARLDALWNSDFGSEG